jgi:hypothetical protein
MLPPPHPKKKKEKKKEKKEKKKEKKSLALCFLAIYILVPLNEELTRKSTQVR